MIKLGSRTELILPDVEGLSIEVAVGRRVKAGRSVVAQFANPDAQIAGTSAAATRTPDPDPCTPTLTPTLTPDHDH